jgi:hypothetical protein
LIQFQRKVVSIAWNNIGKRKTFTAKLKAIV